MRMMSERIIGAKEEAADAKLCSRVRTSPCGYRAEARWIGRSSSRIDYNNTRKMRKADLPLCRSGASGPRAALAVKPSAGGGDAYGEFAERAGKTASRNTRWGRSRYRITLA